MVHAASDIIVFLLDGNCTLKPSPSLECTTVKQEVLVNSFMKRRSCLCSAETLLAQSKQSFVITVSGLMLESQIKNFPAEAYVPREAGLGFYAFFFSF